MAIIGEAFVAVRPDTQGFAANAEKGVLGSVTGIAKKAAALIGGAFVVQKGFDFLKDSVAAARESNAVAAQTAAVIKSTGGAANVTAKEVDRLADSIARKTGVDDEQIAKASNLLLTFTNVANRTGKNNDIFNQATKIAVDMGKALGTDAAGSAIQLGKALNDPIQGITALTRVGVTFSDAQKKQIENFQKQGKVAEAQKIILAELGKEFGGSAEAQATASDRLKVTLGNLQEQIGQKLVPIIDKAASFLADKLPAALDTAGRAFDTIKGVIGPVIDAIKPVIDILFRGDFTGGLGGEDSPVVANLFNFRDSVKEVFASVEETIAGLVSFVTDNAPKFQEAFGHVVNAIKIVIETLEPIVRPIIEFFINEFVARVQFIVEIFKQVALLITNIINGDFGAAFGNLKNIVGTVVEFVRGEIGRIATLLAGVVPAVLRAAIGIGKAIIEGIGKGLASAVGFAGDVASGVLKAIKNIINTQVIDRINSAIPDSLGAGPFKVNLPKNPVPRLAAGALVQHRPGGILANIGEGGRDEAVLPLPPGVIEGLQAIANGSQQPLVGQMILQGATTEAAERNASAVVRQLRAEAWKQGK